MFSLLGAIIPLAWSLRPDECMIDFATPPTIPKGMVLGDPNSFHRVQKPPRQQIFHFPSRLDDYFADSYESEESYPDSVYQTPARLQRVIHTNCRKPGLFALTYDDGISDLTDELLDILRAEGVYATFFILGFTIDQRNPNFNRNSKLLKRIIKEGHDIGSHSFSHPDFTAIGREKIIEELADTWQNIASIIREPKIKLFRPPYGNVNDNVLEILWGKGYHVVKWNHDPKDWSGISSAQLEETFIGTVSWFSRRSQDSFISLQHDTHQSTIDAQVRIIRSLKKMGWRLVTITECLGL